MTRAKSHMRQPRGLYLGLNTSIQQFVKRKRLNDPNYYLLYFPEEDPKQLDQDEIIEILDQTKVNANIDIFEMSCEESVSYLKRLENLQKIRRTNLPSPTTLPVDKKKSVTSSVRKLSKNHKESNMCCNYCDKNNHNTADCRAIAKFNWQKKDCFEAKSALKRNLKPEKTARCKKSTEKGCMHHLYCD
jgi:hypothetical protein